MQQIVAITVRVNPVFRKTEDGLKEFMKELFRNMDNTDGVYGYGEGYAVKEEQEGVLLLCKDEQGCNPVCICGNTIYTTLGKLADDISLFLHEDLVKHRVAIDPPVIPEKAREWIGGERRGKERIPDSKSGQV